MNTKFLIYPAIVLAGIFSTSSNAAVVNVTSKVITIYAANGNGGCMMKVDNLPAGCSSTFVGLDCDGAHFPNGELRLSSAISAGLAGKKVFLQVDNAKKTAAGMCIAKRLDILL